MGAPNASTRYLLVKHTALDSSTRDVFYICTIRLPFVWPQSQILIYLSLKSASDASIEYLQAPLPELFRL